MAGDLEDFLRRAAQRRQQKSAGQQQPAAPARRKPQYSDSRTERNPRPAPAGEPVITAEIIQDVAEASTNRSANAPQQRAEAAKRAADQAKANVAAAIKSAGNKSATQSSRSDIPHNPLVALVRQLQRPGGIQQAILMREILDRPEHRW